MIYLFLPRPEEKEECQQTKRQKVSLFDARGTETCVNCYEVVNSKAKTDLYNILNRIYIDIELIQSTTESLLS